MPRGLVELALSISLVVLAATLAAGTPAVAPTDIVAVDEFIDAPHVLFGRTRAAVERALGAPLAVEVRTLAGASSGSVERVDSLTYRGVVIAVAPGSAAVRRVQISEARWTLPRGLNIGVTRERVASVLGEPQLVTDSSMLYLYSDAYPSTVEFLFRGDHVHRIEWLYAPAE
jgi:hypothetical protein